MAGVIARCGLLHVLSRGCLEVLGRIVLTAASSMFCRAAPKSCAFSGPDLDAIAHLIPPFREAPLLLGASQLTGALVLAVFLRFKMPIRPAGSGGEAVPIRGFGWGAGYAGRGWYSLAPVAAKMTQERPLGVLAGCGKRAQGLPGTSIIGKYRA